MGRIMIAGTSSGCGKTSIVCAVLKALTDMGKKVVSFKCGPDYIDPMFHSRIIGTKSRNLDGFFMDPEISRYLLKRNSNDAELAVIEGVMGYYDGIGMTQEGSSYQMAVDTRTPVILVVNCKGMSRSIMAQIDGYLGFTENSGIRGIIFNQLPESLFPAMKEYCEKKGVEAIGYFPHIADAELGSRHLGLITADEVKDLKNKIFLLSENAKKYLDFAKLLAVSEEAEMFPEEVPKKIQGLFRKKSEISLRIALARDLAFSFYYEDNLMLLRDLGCEIVEFSPLKDRQLPLDCDGLILGGGYPELHGKELEQNVSMRESIKSAVRGGLPVHAECGGFMYLHQSMQTPDGQRYWMAGVLPGNCCFTKRLQHFGYVKMKAQKNTPYCKTGDEIKAHEFHRSISDLEQDVFLCEKNKEMWISGTTEKNLIAGFPHLHYFANPDFVDKFVEQCRIYHIIRNERGKHI